MPASQAMGGASVGLLELPFAPLPGEPGRQIGEPTERTDFAALAAFYEATGGDSWADDANWLTELPLDQWSGVSTDGSGRVRELRLAGNGLTGTIPGQLGQLAKLAVLDLSENQLTGPLPASLGGLKNLESLNLSRNRFTGAIPPEFGLMANLTELDLAVNQLEGPIPPELGDLPSIKRMLLGENGLQGRIPPRIFAPESLNELVLNGNRLSGPIPIEIGDAANLKIVNLASNQLSGKLPVRLGDLARLTELNAQGNLLSGAIPPDLGRNLQLSTLDLAGNDLSGPIPREIGNLTLLTQIRLQANRLEGSIPAAIGNLVKLTDLDLARNQLSGPIPSELGRLQKMRTLLLNGNRLSGPFPPQLGAMALLDSVYIGDNSLSGCAPGHWFEVRENDLGGSIHSPCPFGLAGLTVIPGFLEPRFDATRREYLVRVAITADQVSFQAMAGPATVAFLSPQGRPVRDADRAVPGHQVRLDDDETLVLVRATSDYGEQADYNVRIVRGPSTPFTVVDSLYVQAPGNKDLAHNIPDLEVVTEGRVLRADFLTHFRETGQIERWGYPTSEVLALEPNTLTQFYQRGAVDFHRRGDGWVLERRLAWDYVGGGAGGSPDQGVEEDVRNPNPGRVLGPWGHKVSNVATDGTPTGFADFFDRLGGVQAFGFPKTDAREDSGRPGSLQAPGADRGFIRQYFQAAVLEFHPQDAQSPVKLTLLGDTLRERLIRDWEVEPAFARADELAIGGYLNPVPVLPIGSTPAWFTEPPDQFHAQAAATISQLLLADFELGTRLFGFTWIADGVKRADAAALADLEWARDADRATATSLVGMFDGLRFMTSTRQRRLAAFAHQLIPESPTAARALAGAAWFQDGLNRNEAEFTSILARIAAIDPATARSIAESPGAQAGITGADLQGFHWLSRIAAIDPEAANAIAKFQWLRDGLDQFEVDGLMALSDLARANRALLHEILATQWIADEIRFREFEVLFYLGGMDRGLAAQLVNDVDDSYALEETINSRRYLYSEYSHLAESDWYQDGLDELDRAYLVALEFAHRLTPDLFAEFGRERYFTSSTITRPGGGELSIWVFQNGPVGLAEDLAQHAAIAARFTENFLQVPLRFENLIVLSLSPGSGVEYEMPPLYGYGRPILVHHTGSIEQARRTVYQGVVDQFIGIGHIAMNEGRSQMVASLIRDELGTQRLDDRIRELESLYQFHCRDAGVLQVRYLVNLLFDAKNMPPCVSTLSELFMLKLHGVLGSEAIGLTLRRLSLLPFTERGFYNQIQTDAPDGRHSEISRIFRIWYGMTWPWNPPRGTDKHGDVPGDATPVAIGSTTSGSFDHRQDVDYLSINAKEGHLYSIRYTQMDPSLVGLVISDADGYEHLRQRTTERSEPRSHWIAPETGRYFIALTAPGGQLGSYRLAVRLLGRYADDHADEAEFATVVPVGRPVEGTLGHFGDLDVFRFSAETGRTYRISATNDSESFAHVDLIDADRVLTTQSPCRSRPGRRGAERDLHVLFSRDYFFAYYTASGEAVDYRLEIREISACGE